MKKKIMIVFLVMTLLIASLLGSANALFTEENKGMQPYFDSTKFNTVAIQPISDVQNPVLGYTNVDDVAALDIFLSTELWDLHKDYEITDPVAGEIIYITSSIASQHRRI